MFRLVGSTYAGKEHHAVRAGGVWGHQGRLFSFSFAFFKLLYLSEERLGVNFTCFVLFDSSGRHFENTSGRERLWFESNKQ